MENVIIDTDLTSNIDDEFALAYALGCQEFKVVGVTLASFMFNYARRSYKDGMIDGISEARRIARLCGKRAMNVYKGALGFISQGCEEKCDGVDFIIKTAKKKKVTICCLATLTNIALAIKQSPEIARNIKVVWMGTGHIFDNKFTDNNYIRDVRAFEIVLNSDCEFVVIPSYVGRGNVTSIYEAKEHIALNPIGRHLVYLMETNPFNITNRGLHIIYDIMPITFVKDTSLLKSKVIPASYLIKDKKVSLQDETRKITYVYDGARNAKIWLDFVSTISSLPSNIFAKNIFFTSDTHFSQKGKMRTKETDMNMPVDQRDHEYIKKWNSVVGKGDIVYHLGDFGNYEILKQLNGHVILICGNYEHEEFNNKTFPEFKKKMLRYGFKDVFKDNLVLDKSIFGQPVNLTHKPSDCKDNMFNLFGHVHSLKPVMKNGFNVCLEYHNFVPVSKDFVADYMVFLRTLADHEVTLNK